MAQLKLLLSDRRTKAMDAIDRVAVIGAGAMGTGLAVHLSGHGAEVTLVDHRQSNLQAARAEVDAITAFLAEHDPSTDQAGRRRKRISYSLDLEEGVADVGLVLETVSEDLATKRDVIATAASANGSAILATNTSSLRLSAIAEAIPDDAGRFVGAHWWYPPYLLRPVEVVSQEAAEPATVDTLAAFIEAVDRDPIRVRRDVPGFVWNRVQFAVIRECLHLAQHGVASIEDINRAVRDGYARRTAVIGPFETIDIAGLELFKTVAEGLYPHLCDRDSPHDLFMEYLDRGRGGVESGAGFFDHEAAPDEIKRDRDERLAELLRLFAAG